MKKLNKVFVVLLFAVALMLLLTVNSSATVDKAMVTNEAKTITFDANYYLNTYPDLKAAFGNDSNAAYEHFLDHGISEGRCAKLTFDVAYYLNSYKDLQDAFGNDYEAAYRHFITNGAVEGRSGCLVYDSAYYAENNKDVKDAFGDNNLKIYEHYVTYGIAEGRQASEEFNVKCYLKKYKDLKDAYTETGYANGFMHYLTYGIDEGRIGTHEYKETAVPATCEEDGYTEKVCACGDVQKVIIPSPGHKYSEAQEVTAEDTEAAGKVHKHVCEACGKVEYFDDAHNYGEEPTSTTATCTEAGEETYTCSVCGKVDVRKVEAYGHDFKLNEGERLSTTTPATCGKAGFDEYVCETCGTLRLVAVQATGKHTLTKVEAKEATCTEPGNNEYYTCSVCKGVFKDEAGTQSTTVEKEVIPVKAHTMTKTEAKEATCTEPGNNEYYTCSVCKGVFKDETGTQPTTVEAETLPLASHTMEIVAEKAATCTEAGNKAYYKCTVCDKYFEDAAGETEITDKESVVIPASESLHAWIEGDPTNYGLTAPTCTEDGYTVQVCSTCGDVEITATTALGHDYEYAVSQEDETKHIGTCKNDESHTVTEEHVYGEAVASETYEGLYEKTCEKCGYVKYYTEGIGTENTEVTTVDSTEDLSSAISNASDGDTILLTEDVTFTSPLIVNEDITLNIGNSNLTLDSNNLSINGANVVIDGEGTISSSNEQKAIQVENGTLTLDGGNINSSTLYGVMLVDSKLVINDGTISSKDSSISGNATNGYMEIEINGGTITSETDAAIYMPCAGSSITVNGGTLNGGISARMGNITINGGTINSIKSGNDLIEDYYGYSGNVWLGDAIACMTGTYGDESGNERSNDLNITINGGTINGLCNGCSAVTIYNLGKVEQNISVTISENANLTVSDETQKPYKVVSAADIVPAEAGNYEEYTTYTNAVTENVPEILK